MGKSKINVKSLLKYIGSYGILKRRSHLNSMTYDKSLIIYFSR